MVERNFEEAFENLSITTLDKYLTEFYAQVRNTDGNFYAKSTYVGIRASISRYLRGPPLNRTFSILSDKEFHKSNQMFLAMLKKLKREGMDRSKHHSSISEGDLEKLRRSNVLGTDNPKSLQRKVWFDIMLSFGRRGRENMRKFTTKSFEVLKDDRGHEYCQIAHSETTKNHKGGLDDDDFETRPRMYSTNKADCPVKALKLYLRKRNPASDHFFQQGRAKIAVDDEMWYTSRPVGERTLNEMMKNISKDAELIKLYTNHCVRATTVSVLAHAGVSNREIMKVTGHRCEASLDSYNADSSDQQKRSYSSILQGESSEIPEKTQQDRPNNMLVVTATGAAPPPFSSSSISQVNNMCNTRINNQVTLPCMYQKQFEVHNSTVQVYNYFSHP